MKNFISLCVIYYIGGGGMFVDKKRLVIVPSLSANMFRSNISGKLHYIKITNEDELKHVLLQYGEIVSYMRHQPTQEYLSRLNPKIRLSEQPEYIFSGNEDLLLVSLNRRPDKQRPSPDIPISGFSDLMFVLIVPESSTSTSHTQEI